MTTRKCNSAFATRSSACARQLIADLVRAGARVRFRDADGRYLAGDARVDWMDHLHTESE